jgi:hypothetical protein
MQPVVLMHWYDDAYGQEEFEETVNAVAASKHKFEYYKKNLDGGYTNKGVLLCTTMKI